MLQRDWSIKMSRAVTSSTPFGWKFKQQKPVHIKIELQYAKKKVCFFKKWSKIKIIKQKIDLIKKYIKTKINQNVFIKSME